VGKQSNGKPQLKSLLKAYFQYVILFFLFSHLCLTLGQAQIFTNLHSFTSDPYPYNNDDGSNPQGGLILSGNILYGTTAYGGYMGNGTVFAISTDGSNFSTLYKFQGGNEGVSPQAGLAISGNNLFGTTVDGGSSYSGFIFETTTSGGGISPIHSLSYGSDGGSPESGLVLNNNTLYGTTTSGGNNGKGTIFSVNTDSTGFANLYSFDGEDGSSPYGGLVLIGNTLYGTTAGGGNSGNGTVFALNTDGTGFTNLYKFNGSDGSGPLGGLASSGNRLYGTTSSGGSSGNGTVFAINIDGSAFTNMHSFASSTDGASPYAGLILSGNELYGTTLSGGLGAGTVFEINADGTSFTNIHNFTGSDGASPQAGLVLTAGTLYGTTVNGGDYGYGTVFRLSLPPQLSDLLATSFFWNATNATFDFSYTNQGGPTTSATTAQLFWATGTTIDTAVTNSPIYTTQIPAGFTGQATIQVPESYFQSPLSNATYLQLVLDPNNLVTETTKTNNTLALQNTFRHVVLVMMENRSFDHFLGWLPGAAGMQSGLTYTNVSGQAFPTWHLTTFQGCGCILPDQSFGAKTQYDNGACDGWLLANPNDNFSIGYYIQSDLAFLGQAATNWTVCDNYFAPIMAETQPNRIYQHAAQTDCLTNRSSPTLTLSLPTIWDNLSTSNLTGRYYHAGFPFLNLWGTKYNSISMGINRFYTDCSNGNLPAVSFVDPLFTSTTVDAIVFNETGGVIGNDTGGNDDHPHSDIRKGEAFLANIYNNITSGSQWSSTILIINFDEWGGFFDHVPPSKVPYADVPDATAYINAGIPTSDPTYGLRGFRVPCLVISPWSHGGNVSSELFDHTSVLKLIENHWNLPRLTARDLTANDLADVLDLGHPDFTPPPQVSVPQGPFGGACKSIQITTQSDGSIAAVWDATCIKIMLQRAPLPTGPWADLTNVLASPYSITAADVKLINAGFLRFRIIQQ
jgi:phospholipase C